MSLTFWDTLGDLKEVQMSATHTLRCCIYRHISARRFVGKEAVCVLQMIISAFSLQFGEAFSERSGSTTK